jgi:AcrR family transcriptional regulator
VTLRSVAREIGIAAPSIYAHFADREAIVEAVVDEAFEDLLGRVTRHSQDAADPVEGLVAGCLDYARFALDEPGPYRILFGRVRPPGAPVEGPPRRLAAFTVLVDALAACVAAGRSASTDPFADAAEIWSALHGAAALRLGASAFPWPPIEHSVRLLVYRIGLIIQEPTDSGP